MIKIVWIFLVLVGANLISAQLKAAIEVYEFSDESMQERYLDLTKELRCPKCQNQDIADSNAPIASDMRREVHRLLEEGKSNDDIVAYMVERFGEFATYKPKVIPATYLLWYGPWVLVFVGLAIIVTVSRRRKAQEKNAGAENQDVKLNPKEHQQVEQLISRFADDAPADSQASQSGGAKLSTKSGKKG